MGKIATEEYAANIGKETTSNPNKCCTKTRAEALGCTFNTGYSYENNQLVEESSLKRLQIIPTVLAPESLNDTVVEIQHGNDNVPQCGAYYDYGATVPFYVHNTYSGDFVDVDVIITFNYDIIAEVLDQYYTPSSGNVINMQDSLRVTINNVQMTTNFLACNIRCTFDKGWMLLLSFIYQ